MNKTDEQFEMRAVISGKVQGIGFRAHTYHYATQLGLKGQVRNLNDGTVEILAQGSQSQLKNLLNQLTSHFKLQHESIQSSFGKPSQTFDDFFIIH